MIRVIIICAVALSGCSYLDRVSGTDEAKLWQAVWDQNRAIPVPTGEYDEEVVNALIAKRVESPGIRMFAQTPQGAATDRANMHDLLSTAVGLSVQDAATEVNPLGYALIPLKVLLGRYVIDPMPCIKRAQTAGIVNSMFHGLSTNNWAVALGALPQVSIPAGIVGGIVYYTFRTNFEPGVYTCSRVADQ